jgi:carboxymethylenebutenolidase
MKGRLFLLRKRRGRMVQKILNLFDDHLQGFVDRREFIQTVGLMVGGTVAANGLFDLLQNNHAEAQIIPENDPRLHTETITYPGETGKVMAYLARPKNEKKLPGVIVIHENKGLNAHIKDVNRRVALEGFLAIAPDALSPVGGTPEDPNAARGKFRELDYQKTVKDFVAAVNYLKTHPNSTSKIGCTGFCWGGGMTNQVAVHSPDLIAAVPYYGRQPAIEDIPKIKADFLLHYAGEDQRINAGIPAFEDALKKAKIDYKIFMYEGAKHAFNNDTNPSRYHKEAALLAFERTIAFFKEKLKT